MSGWRSQPAPWHKDVLQAQDQHKDPGLKISHCDLWRSLATLGCRCGPPGHHTDPRRPLQRSTGVPCPIPTSSHLSLVRAQTLPLIIPDSFSQVIPKAKRSLSWSVRPTARPAHRLPLLWHFGTQAHARAAPGQGRHRCPVSSQHQTPTNQRKQKTRPRGQRGRAEQGTGSVQWSVGELPQATGMGRLVHQSQIRRCRRRVEDSMQAEHEHSAPCGSGAAPSRNTKQKRQSLQHLPAHPEDAASKRESLSGKSRGQLMLFFKPGRQDNPVKQIPPRPQLSARVQLLKLF